MITSFGGGVDKQDNLNRQLGLISALSVVVGIVLGAGAFMKPPQILSLAGNTSLAMAAWAVGGFFAMCGGLTLCELAVRFPQTGGIYVYLQKLYGEKTAYLYAWTVVFIYGAAACAAVSGYFGSVFCYLFGVNSRYQLAVAVGVLGFVWLVNSVSVKAGGRLQVIVTFCKLAPVFLLIFAGLWKGSGQVLSIPVKHAGPVSFATAVLATLFAYDGWAQLTSLAGEIKNPSKNLPRAIIGGISFLIVVYLLINYAFISVMAPDKIVELGHDAAVIIAQNVFGLQGGNLVSLAIMIALLGGANGLMMAVTRILYTLGMERRIVGAAAVAHLDKKGGTPVVAMAAVACTAVFYCAFFDADTLSNIVMFAIWIFYSLTFVGVFIARRRYERIAGVFRVPLYPLTPILALCGAAVAMYGMMASSPVDGIISVIIAVLGLPVYYISNSSKARSWLKSTRAAYIVACIVILSLFGFVYSAWQSTGKQTILVATEPTAPPFTFKQNNLIVGYDIDVIKRAGELAGCDVEVRPVAFQMLLSAVKDGFVQVAANALTPTSERAKEVAFTDNYFDQGLLSVAVHTHEDINNAGQLSGLRIGTKAATTAEMLLKNVGGVKVIDFESLSDMQDAFNRGELDGVFYLKQTLDVWIKQKQLHDAHLAIDLTRESYSFAVGKNNPELLKALNSALDQMRRNGNLAELQKKWFEK